MVQPGPEPAESLTGLFPATRVDRTGREFRVELYSSDQASALQRFYESFEPKRCAQGLPPAGADRIARWLEQVLPHGLHLLAWSDTELVGHGLLVPTGRTGIWEWAIFLAEAHRGRGMGTEMNRLAIAAARQVGLAGLWLSVEPHNRAAVRSYEKVGFQFATGSFLSSEAEMEIRLENATERR
jgi:diamine N-acetyltransferase